MSPPAPTLHLRAPWGEASPDQWSDWRWQHRNRLRTLAELESLLELTEAERAAFARCAREFRVAITPYYARLMDPHDPACPVRRQAVPELGELETYPGMRVDPLAEESHSPVPGLVHRYPDRVLLYATHHCPVYCRHCTRKRKVADPRTAPGRGHLAAAVAWIRAHPVIRDVLISGGDPLSLSTAALDELLGELLAIGHVEIVRLGTRNPVTLPQRIDEALAAMLRCHRPVYVNTHFNHPKECTPEAALALERLADAGCVLGNQMVLLRGINDEAETVRRLNRWLLRHRCRPYYILHCDLAPGVAHFRTTIDEGRALMAALRGHISGLAVPQYVVDLPGGGGKVALLPEYELPGGPAGRLFKNYQGRPFLLPEPPPKTKTPR